VLHVSLQTPYVRLLIQISSVFHVLEGWLEGDQAVNHCVILLVFPIHTKSCVVQVVMMDLR
jgi:hypothetical protein